jgi:integrase
VSRKHSASEWEDVDFETLEIRVRFQMTEDGKLKRPKTKAGVRSVPLLPVLAQTLRKHRKDQLSLGLAGPEQFIFTTATGKPLDRHNVRNEGIVRAAERAGLHEDGPRR